MGLISTAETTSTGVSTWEDGPTLVSDESAWKRPVRVASTADVDLVTEPTTLDGVTLADGDRIGLFGQTDASENGLYERITSTSWQRTSDFESGALVEAGVKVYVQEGTDNREKTFKLITPGDITVGTTATTWVEDQVASGWSSVTVTSSSTASSAKYNIFDADNYGAFTSTSNVTDNNVAYTSTDGRFTAGVDGTFLIMVTCIIQSNSTTGVANVSFDVNGGEVYTAQVTIHSTVDPVERTFAILKTLSEDDYVEAFIDSTDADTMQIMAGTTMNMARLGAPGTESKAWASETVTATSTASDAKYDIFDEDNYGAFTSTSNVTAKNVTYTSTDGRFTANTDGTYELDVTVYISISASAVINMSAEVNGSQVWTAGPFVNNNVDPVERTITLLQDLTAGDYVNFYVDSATATRTVQIHPGTTANIQKIG
jgi:hypothetical protein